MDHVLFENSDLLCLLCEHLTLSDIKKLFYLNNSVIHQTLLENKRWILDHHIFIRPHGHIVDEHDGTQHWFKKGKLHRDGDSPAVIYADGSQYWFKEGKLHRDGDSPAVTRADGSQCWYKNEKKHRDGDLPAEIWADGTQHWYKEGKLHRDKDLPVVVDADGTQIKNAYVEFIMSINK
jgi:hypothetical protein